MSGGYETVLGISFGNTSSSIAFQKDSKVQVIANQDGDRFIPSVISYVNGVEFHGLPAKNQLIRNPKNTIANFRDFLGEQYQNIDPTYCHSSAHPKEINGEICFEVTAANNEESSGSGVFTIEQVVTSHLASLRESASDFIGKPIDGAVIAVPTDFKDAQRQELVNCAKNAGIEFMQVINEPTAALLAHVAAHLSPGKSGRSDSSMILVVDIGGTRTDGAVMTNRGGIFNILATHHDYELGGCKLDEALIEYVRKEFEKKHKLNPMSEPRAVAKLRAESETVKITLSNTASTTFAVESLIEGIDFHISINRMRFELAGRLVFHQFAGFVEHLIKKANLDELDFDEVLLVGGSSFVPKVASTIGSLFDPSKTAIISPSTDSSAVDPRELVARGAALQASLISIFDPEEIQESLQPVATVAPHTVKPIGVKVDGDLQFVTMVEPNTALPFRTSLVFETAAGTESVLIGIYEGESEIVVTHVSQPAPVNRDDEDSWSEDDQEQQLRTKIVKPGKKLAEAGLVGITKGSKVEVQINITRDLKLQMAARELRPGGVAIRGELPCATFT